MKPDDKFAYSFTTGFVTTFVSCMGGGIYHESLKGDSYSEEYKHICGYDANSFIFASSAITGIVMMLLVFTGITAYESYKESQESECSFWSLFMHKLFTKENIFCLIALIVLGIGIAFLGFLIIGLAVFLIPLMKGKFK